MASTEPVCRGWCVERRVEVEPVNTRVLELQSYKEMEDCFWGCWNFKHPFQVSTTSTISLISLISRTSTL